MSGQGVQTTLLKLMEETEVPARAPHDMAGQIQAMMDGARGGKGGNTINTKHILFVERRVRAPRQDRIGD